MRRMIRLELIEPFGSFRLRKYSDLKITETMLRIRLL